MDENQVSGAITLIRTRISLNEEEYEAAKAEADRLGISPAELLRRPLRHMQWYCESQTVPPRAAYAKSERQSCTPR